MPRDAALRSFSSLTYLLVFLAPRHFHSCRVEFTGHGGWHFGGEVKFSSERALQPNLTAFICLPKHFFGSIQISVLQLRTRRHSFRQINQIGKEFEPGLERALFVALLYERSHRSCTKVEFSLPDVDSMHMSLIRGLL